MNSVGLQFARAVKVWLRDTAPLSFTHHALQSSFGQTVLTLEDRQMGSGAFRIPFFSSSFFFFFFLVVYKTDWGGGGGGGVHLEYSPSLTVGRTSSIATNCSSKVWEIRPAVPVLHNEATEPFCVPHARFPRQSDIYFKTLFISVPFCIVHRRFMAGIKLFHMSGKVHADLSPSSSRPTSSSLRTL